MYRILWNNSWIYHFCFAGNPIILSSSFSDPSADIPSVGQAWFHVDSDCQLRYDIYTEEADIGGTDVTASIMYVDRKLKQRSVALSGFLGNWVSNGQYLLMLEYCQFDT